MSVANTHDATPQRRKIALALGSFKDIWTHHTDLDEHIR